MKELISIIIPAYNEQECILNTVASIKAAGYDYVVINDGSQDGTLRLCREHDVNILDLPQNLGIGGAVQAGHKYAQRFGYDIDIQVDGDGQHDPSYIPELVKLIEGGASLAIGSRFLVETDGFQSTFMRRVGIRWRVQAEGANTRLARMSALAMVRRSSALSTRSRSANRRLAWRRRMRSSALRTLRALAKCGWAMRRCR